MFKTNKSCLLTYILIAICGMGISTIGIAYKNYDPLVVLGLTFICDFFVLLINLIPSRSENPNTLMFMLVGVFRFILMGVGLVLSALFIYLTRDSLGSDKSRYLFVLLGLIPIVVATLLFYLRSRNEI